MCSKLSFEETPLTVCREWVNSKGVEAGGDVRRPIVLGARCLPPACGRKGQK